MSAVRFLDWDSAFFQRRIGALSGEGLDVGGLDRALDESRRMRLDCLYFLVPQGAHGLHARAGELGFAAVDTRVTFEATLAAPTIGAMPDGVRESRANDIPHLRALAAHSHQGARFWSDTRFTGRQAAALYAFWIEKSCQGWADVVLVAEHEGRAVGYISCHLRAEHVGEIGLVAVSEDVRGRGIGKALLDTALAWFRAREVERVRVVTQERNAGAQALYRSRGFHPTSRQVWHHRWFDIDEKPMTKYRIPFNKPSFVGNETRYIAEALERGHISGDGHFTKSCNALLERSLGVRKVLLTTNCTHALEMCALLLDLKAGDEVIVPSFAFVTTALAFVLRGAKPVFADVRADTLNLDERQLEALITPRTKAIVVLHYGGVACEMDAILAIAARHGVPVVEDNAHGLFAKYKGRWLGTFGALATQSFHETKNFTCGEGGALLVNDPRLVERAEILREKGTNRSRFMRGLVHKYTWVDLGSSYLPSDLLAAFLLAQLEARDEIQKRRAEVWQRYSQELAGWALEQGVQLPHVPEHCEQPYHLFYMLLRDSEQRSRLITHLEQSGILAVFHYLPLNQSAMGKQLGGVDGQCPVAENVSSRLLRLPFFNRLSESEQGEVIAAVLAFS